MSQNLQNEAFPSDINNLHNHSISISDRSIYLYGRDEDSTISNESCIRFLKNLNYLNKIDQSPITIHLLSLGGSVDPGWAIYDSILKSPSEITIIAYGLVASMASIILQAAKIRIIHKRATLMVHSGYMSIEGATAEISKNLVARNMLDIDIMYSVYINRMKNAPYWKDREPKQIKSFIAKKLKKFEDWYLSANEALEIGLIDRIL